MKMKATVGARRARPRRRAAVIGLTGCVAMLVAACGSSGSGGGNGSSSSSGSSGSSASSTGFSGSPVVIGQEVCQTGYLAADGVYLVQGAKLAAKAINAQGGILHHQVQVVTKDTQCVATNEISIANSFISQNHVDAIIGGYQSAAISGVLPIVQKSKVPFIGGGTLPLTAPWGITTFPPNTQVPKVVVGYYKKHGVTNLGNVSGNTPFGAKVQKNVDTVAKAAGVKTQDLEVADSATSTTPLLERLSKTQAIFTNTSGPINIIWAKNASSLGLKKPLIFQDVLPTCEKAAASYSNVECVVAAPTLYPNIANSTIKANDTKVYKLYKASGGTLTNFATVTAGWDQVQLLAKAMTKAHAVTGASVMNALRSTSFTGAQAIYKFTPGHTFGVTGSVYVLTHATANSLKLIYTPTGGV